MKASETTQPKSGGPTPPKSPKSKRARHFSTPEDIIIDRYLGRVEQRRLLDDWKLELEQHAPTTSDPSPAPSARTENPRPEQMLRRVNACRRILSEQEH